MLLIVVALQIVLLFVVLWIRKELMAAIDDLKAAVTRLNASTSAELKAISDKLSSAENSDDPDVEAAATALNALSDKLDTETATLTAPVTPTT